MKLTKHMSRRWKRRSKNHFEPQAADAGILRMERRLYRLQRRLTPFAKLPATGENLPF